MRIMNGVGAEIIGPTAQDGPLAEAAGSEARIGIARRSLIGNIEIAGPTSLPLQRGLAQPPRATAQRIGDRAVNQVARIGTHLLSPTEIRTASPWEGAESRGREVKAEEMEVWADHRRSGAVMEEESVAEAGREEATNNAGTAVKTEVGSVGARTVPA